MGKPGLTGVQPDLLEAARRRAGLTQQQLARAAQLSRASIANYEAGVTLPAVDALYRIAQATNVTVRDFLPSGTPSSLPLLRAELGLSQEELADLLGVSRGTYARWEQGKAAPDADQAEALSRVLSRPDHPVTPGQVVEAAGVDPAGLGRAVWLAQDVLDWINELRHGGESENDVLRRLRDDLRSRR